MKHRVFLIAALFACMPGIFAAFAEDASPSSASVQAMSKNKDAKRGLKTLMKL